MRSEYDHIIRDAAIRWLPAGYDWRLFKAQLWQESKFDPLAVSEAGATGIGQFMRSSWTTWARKAGYSGAKRTNPEASIYASAAYMGWLVGQWRTRRPPMDRYLLAMASYNAGLGHILSAQRLSGGRSGYAQIIAELDMVTKKKNAKETTEYGRKILGHYSRIITGEGL
ncbi:MAG: hypothetical protein COA78_06910 [Blastopirellula sp.]|nr:MAG: hypothetical protein COA78_06910 [Blastopirellula sp.]